MENLGTKMVGISLKVDVLVDRKHSGKKYSNDRNN